MSVYWAEVATGQLLAARDFLARTSPAYAQALAGRIVARAEKLDGRPHTGAEVPEYGDPGIREVYEHPYRVIDRVNGPDIEVVAVLHSARQLPRTPPG